MLSNLRLVTNCALPPLQLALGPHLNALLDYVALTLTFQRDLARPPMFFSIRRSTRL